MSTTLHINSSPPDGRSISQELTTAFDTQWKGSHPHRRVVGRGVNATKMPPVSADWVAPNHTPKAKRTQQQFEQRSDSLLAGLEQAKEYATGVPMHDVAVSTASKLLTVQSHVHASFGGKA